MTYYVGIILIYLLSLTNKNILNLWGYKGTIIKGLLLSTLGQWYLLLMGWFVDLVLLFIFLCPFCCWFRIFFTTKANPFAISLEMNPQAHID